MTVFDEHHLIKWLAIGASYLAILIAMAVRGIGVIRRNTKMEAKVEEIEEDIADMELRHSLDIKKIEVSIEGIKSDNSHQHSILFQKFDDVGDKIEVIGNGVAEINGYLKAKKDV